MTNWILTLTFNWDAGDGRFTTKTWTKVTDGTSGLPVADFIAADVKFGDTISICLLEGSVPAKLVNLHQLVVIFTKQPGAGAEVCSPITWIDPNHRDHPVPLGMVMFQPSSPQPLPWSSGSTTYPANVPLTIAVTGPNAFESTVCAEIWDNSTPPFICFYTHDPDMDVTS